MTDFVLLLQAASTSDKLLEYGPVVVVVGMFLGYLIRRDARSAESFRSMQSAIHQLGERLHEGQLEHAKSAERVAEALRDNANGWARVERVLGKHES